MKHILFSGILLFTMILLTFLPLNSTACTSACIAKNGNVVFGNNLDWFVTEGYIYINKRNVKKRGLWFENPPEWVSIYASITLNQDGREFPTRGMNEVGLVVGEMTLAETESPDADSRKALNTLQWIQYQLDNCGSIAEVIATDKVIRIDKNEYHSHFFVCDSTGECVVMEWLNGKLAAHAYNELPYKVLANNTYDYSLAHINDQFSRFNTVAKMLDQYSTVDPVEYMFSILKNVSQKSTVWSLVFDATNKIMYFKTSKNPEIRYVSLMDFDFSCNTEVTMLDANGPGNGNMLKYFNPFDEVLNSQLIHNTYRQYEGKFGHYTEEFLEKMCKYPSTTKCILDD